MTSAPRAALPRDRRGEENDGSWRGPRHPAANFPLEHRIALLRHQTALLRGRPNAAGTLPAAVARREGAAGTEGAPIAVGTALVATAPPVAHAPGSGSAPVEPQGTTAPAAVVGVPIDAGGVATSGFRFLGSGLTAGAFGADSSGVDLEWGGLTSSEADDHYLHAYTHFYHELPRHVYEGERSLPSEAALRAARSEFTTCLKQASAGGQDPSVLYPPLTSPLGRMVSSRRLSLWRRRRDGSDSAPVIKIRDAHRISHDRQAHSLAWAGSDHLVVGYQDGLVVSYRCGDKVWRPAGVFRTDCGPFVTGAGVAPLKGAARPVVVASGGLDNVVTIHRQAEDATGGAAKVVGRLRAHAGYVASLKFASGGEKLYSASGDGTAMLWDVESGKVLNALIGHTADLERVTVAEATGGQLACTAALDGTSRVWDARSGECERLFQLPTAASRQRASDRADCDISADGTTVVATWAGRVPQVGKRYGMSTFDVRRYQAVCHRVAPVQYLRSGSHCHSYESCALLADGRRCVIAARWLEREGEGEGEREGGAQPIVSGVKLVDAMVDDATSPQDSPTELGVYTAAEEQLEAYESYGLKVDGDKARARGLRATHWDRLAVGRLAAAPDDSGRVASAGLDGRLRGWVLDKSKAARV